MTKTQEEIQQVLTATSNVIELKPDRKYMLVFQGKNISLDSIHELQERLALMGIHTVSVHLFDDIQMQVVETPSIPV